MPVIKNSGRLSFVCFSFSLQIPNQFFSYSSLSSTSSYCRLFRLLLLLLLPIVVGDVKCYFLRFSSEDRDILDYNSYRILSI
jgi:hypothetical protein